MVRVISLVAVVIALPVATSASTPPTDEPVIVETTSSVVAPSSTSTTTTTTTSTTTTITTTTTSTTTTGPAPALGRPVTGAAVAQRGESQLQLVTPPTPPTTTTVPPHHVLPAGSGTGRRVVYSKTLQRVWTVEADGTVSRHFPVSGRLAPSSPRPGTYAVFSRSEHTCNISRPYLCMRYMVRFTRGPSGDNIGFHEIPVDRRYRPPRPVQADWQLGTPLSGGCVRQSTADAQWTWAWAPVGTRVVVLP